MRRREFLKYGSAGLLAAAGLRCAGESEEPAPAAGPWGTPPAGYEHLVLPSGQRPEGVLELFFLGGLTAWETFYAVPEHGDPSKGGPYAGQQYWVWHESSPSVSDVFTECGGGDRPLLVPFAYDSAGMGVHLGPFMYPLRDRTDITDRMRTLVMRHLALPHESATPLMATGLERTNTRMTSPGAHVQRYFSGFGDSSRTAPYSFVVLPDSETLAVNNAESALVGAAHGVAMRPLALRTTPDSPLIQQLARGNVAGFQQKLDAGLDYYLNRFRKRMRSTSGNVHANTLEDYDSAVRGMAKADGLLDLLDPALFQSLPMTDCGVSRDMDTSTVGLRLAAHLLTDSKQPARYVQVMDVGISDGIDDLEGFDTHEHHVRLGGRSIVHTCRALADIINAPGESDPRKLDLNRHMVVLTTEFGRSPILQEGNLGGTGSGHHPMGFVSMIIGGPITTPQINGAIGEDGEATQYVTPAELRAGLMMAQGIWPFTAEGFRVGDVMGATTEMEAAQRVATQVLGVTI